MQANENIELITGNPRRAINKLAFPTIFSFLLMFLNNLIDSFWVSGLNSDALAALGFISPLYLVIIGLGSGVGAGAMRRGELRRAQFQARYQPVEQGGLSHAAVSRKGADLSA